MPVAWAVGMMTDRPEFARSCRGHRKVAVPVEPDGRLAEGGIGDAPHRAEAAAGPGNNPPGGSVARDRRVAGAPIQNDFAGTSPKLLHVAAPLNLLPVVGEGQHDQAGLPLNSSLVRLRVDDGQ